jgi:hypothetical protein
MSVLDELSFLAQMASSAVAEPIAGLAGAGALALGDLDDSVETIESVRGALTLPGPNSSMLQQALTPVGQAFQALNAAYDAEGRRAAEELGAPGAFAAAVLKGALASLPGQAANVARGVRQMGAAREAARPRFATEGYDRVLAYAGPEQRRLESVGAAIQSEIPDVEFTGPPASTIGPMGIPSRDTSKLGRPSGILRAVQKSAEKGRTVEDLTDVVRGSFIARTPEAADAVVARLRNEFPGRFEDEGWRMLPGNYVDRPLKLGIPGGYQAEMQVHLPGMIQAKQAGHSLYEMARSTQDAAKRAALEQEMAAIYGGVLSQLGPEWQGILSGLN